MLNKKKRGVQVEQNKLHKNTFAATLRWSLFILISAIVGLFLGIGWFIVGMCFFTSLSITLISVASFVGVFFNAANGFGAFILALGCALFSTGFIWPTFKIAYEFGSGYLVLTKVVVKKIKSLKTAEGKT